jgi:hypothetical protein
MKLNLKEFMQECGVEEKIYPGKRLVHRLPKSGEFKSHCVVYDWHDPQTLHIEVLAGLSGRQLPPKDLRKFPISFQSPTYIDIDMAANANFKFEEEAFSDDEEDEDGNASSSSGGGKGLKSKKPKALNAFSRVVEGRIPEIGEVKKLVLMGKDIAKNAMGAVLESLAAQIKSRSVAPVNLLANITNVTKVAPGGRPVNEVDPKLLKGVKPYNPKDLFGAGPS